MRGMHPDAPGIALVDRLVSILFSTIVVLGAIAILLAVLFMLRGSAYESVPLP